jgi:hypothetical protein
LVIRTEREVGKMWLTDLEKAIADIKDKICDCCITKITPNWDGGINFHMSNFTTIMWKNGIVQIYKDGEWRNK